MLRTLTRQSAFVPARTTLYLRAMSTATTTSSTATTTSKTPLEDSIRTKITTSLAPSILQINNDSASHAHHSAMRSNYSSSSPNLETHFRLCIVSKAFEGKMQPARHRMVYGLLKEELAMEGGVHALQLTTRTEVEEERLAAKASP